MIYYPLSTLMSAGIREILIITNPHETTLFQQLLSDGSQWGLEIEYAIQEQPRGIAEALIIGENFVGEDKICLILGDNILHGDGLIEKFNEAIASKQHATIFGYYVKDPLQYGVIQFDANDHPVDIIEKPTSSISNYAVIGLYFYQPDVVQIAKHLKPSERGELEITDINRHYLKRGKLRVEKLGRGIAWLDTGTPRTLLDAANFIQVLEERQGLKIGSPEEMAWRMGYINDAGLNDLAKKQQNSFYHEYLLSLL